MSYNYNLCYFKKFSFILLCNINSIKYFFIIFRYQYFQTRPNMETFDPDYENEKKNAYNNLGEFKLKSSPKFVVTEE